MYKRAVYHILEKRLHEKRKFIQVLMGPRQVGKTTLITQLLENTRLPHHFVSADSVPNSNASWLLQQWELARLKCKQKQSEFLLVIDEIQKLDNWSETVKNLWDEDTKLKNPIKVVLLGSSRLLLQQDLSESMAGRFETTYLGHWQYHEMKKAFKWSAEKNIFFGGYPAQRN